MVLSSESTRPALADGPLDPTFWTGEISAKGPALFRIGLATILLGDLILTTPEVDALYGSSGAWPRAFMSGVLAQQSDSVIYGAWGLGALALLALALGLYARVAAVVAWFILVSFHRLNIGATTAGDNVGQIMVFFCVFLDSSAAFSLDAKLRGRGRAFIAAAPWRAMQLHIALLYLFTALFKVKAGWLAGDGIYLSLQHLGFLRPPGALLLSYPLLCRLATYGVLAMEGVFIVFALSPFYGRKSRLLAVACSLGVQLGILATMRVGMFTVLMIWTNVLFLPVAVRPSSTPELARRRRLLAGAGVGLTVLIASNLLSRHVQLRRALDEPLGALGLIQPYDLFGRTYEVAQWHAEGRLANGSPVDVLRAVAPGLISEVGWRFSVMYKLTFIEKYDYAHLGQWLCSSYTRQTGQKLHALKLWKRAAPPVHPGERAVFQEVTLFEGACAQR